MNMIVNPLNAILEATMKARRAHKKVVEVGGITLLTIEIYLICFVINLSMQEVTFVTKIKKNTFHCKNTSSDKTDIRHRQCIQKSYSMVPSSLMVEISAGVCNCCAKYH